MNDYEDRLAHPEKYQDSIFRQNQREKIRNDGALLIEQQVLIKTDYLASLEAREYYRNNPWLPGAQKVLKKRNEL